MPDRLQSSLFLVFNYRSFWTSTTQSAIFLTLFQQYPDDAQMVWRWRVTLVLVFPAVRATWHHVTNKAERELSSRCFDERSPLKRSLRRSTLKWSSNSTDIYLLLAVAYLPKKHEEFILQVFCSENCVAPLKKNFLKTLLSNRLHIISKFSDTDVQNVFKSRLLYRSPLEWSLFKS